MIEVVTGLGEAVEEGREGRRVVVSLKVAEDRSEVPRRRRLAVVRLVEEVGLG